MTRHQQGVGLVTAIFLLVVLAGLAVALVTISTGQQTSSALDVMGARAYQAARAGVEWGLYQANRNSSCVAQSNVAMPAGTTLAPFTVTVTCAQQVTGTAPNTVTTFLIRSAACTQPVGGSCFGAQATNHGPDFVYRQVEVRL